jgi:two-component system invasion response regulator UvrY
MRILLVDDHAVVRGGVRRLLADELPDAEFGEASSGHEATELALADHWDVVLLDISLPGRSGLEALKQIAAAKPRLPILIMTMHSEDQYAIRAFRLGASGYITKDCATDEVVAAVRKLAQGGRYVTPQVAEKLAGSLAGGDVPLHEQLSDRELEVVRLLARGKTVTQIAAELCLSEKTISTYRARVLEKLGMKTTAEVIRYAIRAGIGD